MSSLVDWARPQLSRLLPLDPDSIEQIITYTASLSKEAAAAHLKNLLGDSPAAFEFIAAFNTRSTPQYQSQAQPQSRPAQDDRVPRPQQTARPRKSRPNIHALPARQVEGQGNTNGAHRRDESTLQTSSSNKSSKPLASNLALRPDAVKKPTTTSTPSHINPSVSAHPPAKTRVQITGGTAMHGASTVLSDLDSAIRSLEVQTNPLLSSTDDTTASRQCNCMATRHPLLTIAPNCMSCGKVICIKQGLGPCTFCHTPLLSGSEISNVLRILKDERGREKQALSNASHKRAEVATKPKAFTSREFISATKTATAFAGGTPGSIDDPAEKSLGSAREHRDRLLAFQAQNAKRTTIRDEATDYDLPSAGTSIWASPVERARQLKVQQRVMREMEEANKPEWEKRKGQVMSIDVVGNKVVRRMVDAPVVKKEVDMYGDGDEQDVADDRTGADSEKGAFSRNPLLGALIRPIMPGGSTQSKRTQREKTWRRVQDDLEDNEEVILDGGVFGGRTEERAVAVG